MSDQEYNELLLESILSEKDLIPGGLADNTPSSEFDPDQLEKGIKAEMEHTSSREIATEIAKDHLKEDPKYYDKLEKMENEHLTEKSHWKQRKTSKGKKAIKKEYSKHKKRRNETGAAREQNKRVRETDRGREMNNARTRIRDKEKRGEITRPKTCPKCGSNPGTASDGKSNMIWDHTNGYKSDAGQWLCRTCHNKKDNNKPGEKTEKNKRRRSGMGSISKSKGDKNISRAGTSESKETEMIRLISENLNRLDGYK